jgi:hypothetical protein
MKMAPPGFSRLVSPRAITENRRIGSDDNFRLTSLVGDLKGLALRRAGDAGHGGIGHQALRDEAQVYSPSPNPRIASKDVQLDRVILALGALRRSRGDKIAGLMSTTLFLKIGHRLVTVGCRFVPYFGGCRRMFRSFKISPKWRETWRKSYSFSWSE